ncbi:MAG TPA: hypothetical protein VGO09_11600 [Flavisolibacter sp.]|nr:hypothetical protein [Flavisolibacter sp.]
MHYFENVYQYKTAGKVFSKLIPNSSEGDPGYWYSDIHSLEKEGRSYYLAIRHAIYSTKDAYQGRKIFSIVNNSLDDTAKLIKTKTGIRNILGFGFDFFSVADRKERPVKLIDYNSTEKTITIPVVLANGKVTNKLIVYQFTGKYFERKM